MHSASAASTIVSIGSHHSSGSSISAVAPSVATAASGREPVHRDTALVLDRERDREPVSAALLTAYVVASFWFGVALVYGGPAGGSTMPDVMLST